AELNQRFATYFGDASVRVEVDDTILSDAAAGSDYVKVRTGARFSQRDIDILEVHEGWVHVATSLNGQAQTVARWLAKGPPRTTAVQEGLAALLEIFTFRTYPRRARRLNDRVLARRVVDGVVRPPKYLPPMFRDLNGLAIWMAYSTFFSQLGGDAIADHYARIFARAG